MEHRKVIVLVGDSLLMDGVAASIADCPKIEVEQIDPAYGDLKQHVESLVPDLIVFELNSPEATSILSLLKKLSGILLIGIDLTSNQVMVVNSQQQLTQTMKDLHRLLQESIMQTAPST